MDSRFDTETPDDIIRELRTRKLGILSGCHCLVGDYEEIDLSGILRRYADRLENAIRRERDKHQMAIGWTDNGHELVQSSEVSETKPDKTIDVTVWVTNPQDAELNGNSDDEDNPDMPLMTKTQYAWRWDLPIDVDTGIIKGWPKGFTAKTYHKVSDQLCIKWKGKEYEGYVPDFLQIFENGYGDYVHIEIMENGRIKDWDRKKCIDWLSNRKEFK